MGTGPKCSAPLRPRRFVDQDEVEELEEGPVDRGVVFSDDEEFAVSDEEHPISLAGSFPGLATFSSACSMLPHRRVEARQTSFIQRSGSFFVGGLQYFEAHSDEEDALDGLGHASSTGRRRGIRVTSGKAALALAGSSMLLVAACYSRGGGPAQRLVDSTEDSMIKVEAHCWIPCGGKAGACDWCGMGASCCRYGAAFDDAPECRNVGEWSTKHWHTCVRAEGSAQAVDPVMESVRTFEMQSVGSALAEASRAAPQPKRNMQGSGSGYYQGGVVDEGSIHDADVDIAQCTIDVAQAAYSLGQAGTAIAATTKVCNDLWLHPWSFKYGTTKWIDRDTMVDGGQATCSAAVTDVIASLVFSAAFLADSAANCALGYNVQARCAMDVTYLVGSLTELASAASAMTMVCQKGWKVNPIAFDDGGRRLLAAGASEEEEAGAPEEADDRQVREEAAEWTRRLQDGTGTMKVAGVAITVSDRGASTDGILKAECVFDVAQATLFFSRSGDMIARAARDCGGDLALGCAVDLQFMLNAFELVGSYIGYAVAHCSPVQNKQALCMSSIMKVVASLEGVSASGTDFLRSCQAISNEPYPPDESPGLHPHPLPPPSGGGGGGVIPLPPAPTRRPMPPAGAGDSSSGGVIILPTAPPVATLPPPLPAGTGDSSSGGVIILPPVPPGAALPPPLPAGGGDDAGGVIVLPTPPPPATVAPLPAGVGSPAAGDNATGGGNATGNATGDGGGGVVVAPSTSERPRLPPPPVVLPLPPVVVVPTTTTLPPTATPTSTTVTSRTVTTTVTSRTVTTTVTTANTAPLFTFYVYRVQTSETFSLGNVNGGNLGGILWYVQHDVVTEDPPRFGITDIVRYRVQTRAPQRLYNAGMNFGVRFAWNHDTCTGPGNCDKRFLEHGYFVGCNNLGSFPYPQFETYFPGGAWYSLPHHGLCSGVPTGADDCTYSFTAAGSVALADLKAQYGADFWGKPTEAAANLAKEAKVQESFLRKYPDVPESLPAPACDFNYDKFYSVQGPDFR